jgi:hypothetical protein
LASGGFLEFLFWAIWYRENSGPIRTGNNIFNPERKDFAAIGSGMSAKPVVRPQVILYGVTIAGDYRSASVINSGRPLKKGEGANNSNLGKPLVLPV